MTAVAFAAVLAAPGAACAQHMNAPDSPCAHYSGGDASLAACLDRAAKAADGELNRTYGQILPRLSPAERAPLIRAQRAWIAYRDFACAGERALYGAGTGAWPAYLGCREAVTRHRTEELRAGYGWVVEKRGAR